MAWVDWFLKPLFKAARGLLRIVFEPRSSGEDIPSPNYHPMPMGELTDLTYIRFSARRVFIGTKIPSYDSTEITPPRITAKDHTATTVTIHDMEALVLILFAFK
ncbi:hypothetical protein TNCV_5128201 [Trichonephila clavipes]|nr:hypothetical protein TNCV_5128201 [Trichonephila clavipes]